MIQNLCPGVESACIEALPPPQKADRLDKFVSRFAHLLLSCTDDFESVSVLLISPCLVSQVSLRNEGPKSPVFSARRARRVMVSSEGEVCCG